MPNILSIDFDIIMYPCIKLYNDRVGGDVNPTQVWNFLEHEYDIKEFMSYDAKTLIQLAKLIKSLMRQGAKLIPITEHHHLIDKLKSHINYEEQKYNVYNIDFHHDIWYRPEDKNDLTMFDKYNCSNWLGYLHLKDKLDYACWVKAPNSTPYADPSYDKQVLNEICSLQSFLAKDLTFDEIYFCLSPQWVPYEYQHLYNLILSLTSEDDEEEQIITMPVAVENNEEEMPYDEHCNECE